MIEKLTTYPRPLPNNPMVVEDVGMDNESLFNKINELVDTVNELQTRSSNTLIKTLRMDKEFVEDECVRLQNELDRTKKQLDVAVDALKLISLRYLCEYADKALEQITALEQKDK